MKNIDDERDGRFRAYSIVVKDDYDNVMKIVPLYSLSDAIDMATDVHLQFVKLKERVWIAVAPSDELEDL